MTTKLSYRISYTLSNGFKGTEDVTEREIEQLENGCTDINEVIDVNYLIVENNFDEDVYCEDWNYRKLSKDEITILG